MGWLKGSGVLIISGTYQFYFDNKILGINPVYFQENRNFSGMFNNKPKDEGGAGEGGGGVEWSELLADLGFGKNRLAGLSV